MFSFIRLYKASRGIEVVICGDHGTFSALSVFLFGDAILQGLHLLFEMSTVFGPSIQGLHSI